MKIELSEQERTIAEKALREWSPFPARYGGHHGSSNARLIEVKIAQELADKLRILV